MYIEWKWRPQVFTMVPQNYVSISLLTLQFYFSQRNPVITSKDQINSVS